MWGAVETGLASIKFFTDDRERTFVERGLENVRGGFAKQQFVRFLAIFAAVSACFFVFYNIPAQWIGMHADPWPKDVLERSYFTQSVCGEGSGSDRACPDPSVPIPTKRFRVHQRGRRAGDARWQHACPPPFPSLQGHDCWEPPGGAPVLVTGAMGLLGRRVVEVLLGRGSAVVALDVRNSGTESTAVSLSQEANGSGDLLSAWVDLLDPEAVRQLVEQCRAGRDHSPRGRRLSRVLPQSIRQRGRSTWKAHDISWPQPSNTYRTAPSFSRPARP